MAHRHAAHARASGGRAFRVEVRSLGPGTCGEALFDEFTGYVGYIGHSWAPEDSIYQVLSRSAISWTVQVVMDRAAPDVVSHSIAHDAQRLHAVLVATDQTTRPAAATLFVADGRGEPAAFVMDFAEPTVPRTGGDEEHFELTIDNDALAAAGLDPQCLREAWMVTVDEAGWTTQTERVTWPLAPECQPIADPEPSDVDAADTADATDDTVVNDTRVEDSASSDTDGNPPDTATPDTNVPDTAQPTREPDETVSPDPGCGCTQLRGAHHAPSWPLAGLVLLALVAIRWR